MAKKILAKIKLEIPAGKATPMPPVGTALGQHGVNPMEFVKAYNERTASQTGTIIPAEVTIYQDHSFTFICKTPPTRELLKQAAGVEKGSANPKMQKVGKVTSEQVRKIAQAKLADMDSGDLQAAMRMVEGTARSMGIEVTP
jgi:large subunit ribosomal protein L11